MCVNQYLGFHHGRWSLWAHVQARPGAIDVGALQGPSTLNLKNPPTGNVHSERNQERGIRNEKKAEGGSGKAKKSGIRNQECLPGVAGGTQEQE